MNIHHPWLLLGDFNKMVLHQDKMGGAPLKPSQLKTLPYLIKLHAAIDIPCYQKAFSSNGLSNNKPIYET